MNVTPQANNDVHFGFDIVPQANAHSQTAAEKVSSRKLLMAALKNALNKCPDQLETLMAKYKFYFHRGELDKAEEMVFQILVKASLKGGFSNDWRELSVVSTDWGDSEGPGRIFLYSLKALAFIRLRQDMRRDARKILLNLKRLDPHDHVGADVIRDLLDGLSEN